jgi:transcription termination/antitermination protein NusG
MFRWYVVNTYSGHENKVKANLEHRIESMGQRQRFRRVVVPTEQVIETKDGQKVQIEKRILPGYVLVNMDLNDEAWTVVKNTPGVTGFVGAGSKPVPLGQGEVDRILKTGAANADRPRAQVEFSLGESVKVTSGPLVTLTDSPSENSTWARGRSAVAAPVLRILSTSPCPSGTGFEPAPTKPVTPGVFLTTIQASSFRSMLTST